PIGSARGIRSNGSRGSGTTGIVSHNGMAHAPLDPEPRTSAGLSPGIAFGADGDFFPLSAGMELPNRTKDGPTPDFLQRLRVEITHHVFFVPILTTQDCLPIRPDV